MGCRLLWEHGPRGDKGAKARGKLGNPTKPKLRCREVGVSAASRLSPPAFTLRCRILILTGLPCLLVLTVNVKVAAEARDTFGLQQLPPRIASRLQKFRRQAKRQGGSNQSVRCVPVAGRGPGKVRQSQQDMRRPRSMDPCQVRPHSLHHVTGQANFAGSRYYLLLVLY